jgi:transposase
VTNLSQPRIAINDDIPVIVDLDAFTRALPGCSVLTAPGARHQISARTIVNAARRALNRFNAHTPSYKIAAYLRSVGESELRRDPDAEMRIAVLAA